MLWDCRAGDDGGSFLTVTLEDELFPFCDEGEACFRSDGEFLVTDPSCEVTDTRGGVDCWVPALGANVGQLLGLRSRSL